YQSDDGPVRVEIPAPETRLRENGEERAYDCVKFFARELIERQPLAEHPAWRQAPRHGVVHLARIEVPGVGMPWDKEVRYDNIKVVAAGGEIAAPVVEHKAHVGAFEQLSVPGRKIRLCHPGYLRHEFNDGSLLYAQRGSGTSRDTSGEPNERDTARVGMQQQRQQPLAALVSRCCAAAQYVVVIKA